MKTILFLDDSAERAAVQYQRWPEEKRNRTLWVTTAQEAIQALDGLKDELAEVHLDHDLGGTSYQHSGAENCGMSVVRFLENLPDEEIAKFNSTVFIVHSWNIPANRNMTERLQKLGLRATSRLFGN